MLREDYIRYAAAAHTVGARFLRDTVAAFLPCYTVHFPAPAFSAAQLLSQCESLMDNAVSLSAGLIESSGITKYTAVTEARMRLMGIELDTAITQRQTAAERVRSVPPGTRGNVYEGFIKLSEVALSVSEKCVNAAEELIAFATDGRAAIAVPVVVMEFLKRLCSDYGAVCAALKSGEAAELIRRADDYDKCKQSLVFTATAQGLHTCDESSDALASLSSGGLIPSLPPVLFDLLLRYDKLPATASF